MKIKRLKRYCMLLRIFLRRDGYKRADFCREKGYFKHVGEHVYLKPWNFGTEPYLISFGDNVHVATSVTFLNHDVASLMFSYMDKEHQYTKRQGEINIGNNVFIGTNSTLLYDVNIGDNVIIGAGSLVNRDIPSMSIAAGVPAKVVGNFEDYRMKLIKE